MQKKKYMIKNTFYNKKIALITGANTGIGKGISKYFIKKNIFVIGTSTSDIGVKKIKKNLKNNGYGIKLNLLDYKSINKIIEKIYTKFGTIDILVNNAAIKNDNLLIYMTEKEWNDVINVNLTSLFYICKNIVKFMIKKKSGRIINVSSVVADIGNIGQTNYSVSKNGLISFSKSLSLEVARFGITVNTVSPGFINTGMTKNLNLLQKKNFLSTIPMKRFGTVEEISSVIFFLSSSQSSYITGQTIYVNGGIYSN